MIQARRLIVVSVWLISGCNGVPLRQASSAPVAVIALVETHLALADSVRLGKPLYTITDTTEWGNPIEYGDQGVLRRGGVAIDTIDLTFGLAFVGRDSLVFLPVRSDSFPNTEDSTEFFREDATREHLLWTPSGRRELRDWLPYFDTHWSTPSVLDSTAIYYWGIAPPRRQQLLRLYAIRYDFRSRRLDSLYVGEDDIATDYRYYLGSPRVEGDVIMYGSAPIDPLSWRIRTLPGSERSEGWEVSALAQIRGDGEDTLFVFVSLLNAGTAPTRVELTCDMTQVRVSGLTRARVGDWESDRRNSATSEWQGTPGLGCTASRALSLAPGEATPGFGFAVPVRAVLGDSLPPGPYRVQADVRVARDLVIGLFAGAVELRSPAR
jgi:hypothetical protein